jgi:hypothetical protein
MAKTAPVMIGGYRFEFVGLLEPERDGNGAVRRFMPQLNYAKASTSWLHQYGAGPFCRFRLNTGHHAGVYAFLAGDEVRYIGECARLASRNR